jgi:hypothetical protein
MVKTERAILSNKPHLANRDDGKGTCMLIDVAIPGHRNVIQKEGENILKYKDLTIEKLRMWNVKTRPMPLIIGATRNISKSLKKYVRKILGNHEVRELQKHCHIGHCTHTAESADVKVH